MHLAIFLNLILAIPLDQQPGIFAGADWRTGYCGIILRPGAVLIQFEDPPFAGDIGWPRTWPETWRRVFGSTFLRLNIPNWIPIGGTPMYDVRQLKLPGISAGMGRQWALHYRIWWLAIPKHAWHVQDRDKP